ncbi:sulfurtransferase [Aromatoleum sp.]|uniref:sulfurtransferase n=1 Tax=Aromatoleum sp. TaxID=2307007 RepID=UPI002FCBA694
MNASYGTLIAPRELAQHLGEADWRIFDCRHDLTNPDFGRAAYARGHLPGAQFLHIDEDLSGAMSGTNGRHPLPEPDALAARLGRLGVANDMQVVAYDDAGGMFAARLWWLMRWLGHHRVAVLDGGLVGWCEAGQALTPAVAAFPATTYDFSLKPTTVDADFVQGHLRDDRMTLIDARSPDRFRGENETLDPVGGHIPGARNRFFRDNLTARGSFRQASVLREEFARLLGGQDPRRVVHQCGSGVTACHNLLAMESAGLSGSRLYPGSWSEWCANLHRPVATGAED